MNKDQALKKKMKESARVYVRAYLIADVFLPIHFVFVVYAFLKDSLPSF